MIFVCLFSVCCCCGGGSDGGDGGGSGSGAFVCACVCACARACVFYIFSNSDLFQVVQPPLMCVFHSFLACMYIRVLCIKACLGAHKPCFVSLFYTRKKKKKKKNPA